MPQIVSRQIGVYSPLAVEATIPLTMIDQDSTVEQPTRSTSDQEPEDETHTISVLLADDHRLMREGLRQLLELEDDLCIVDEATNGAEAIQKVRQLHPDIVLMDIRMPVLDGITVTQQLSGEFPDLGIIILTMHQQDQLMVQALKSGASGYLYKDASSQEVARAIRTVYAGQNYIASDKTRAIVNEVRRMSEQHNYTYTARMLTNKDLELLRYIAAGLSNREIAMKLSYSEKTVKNYLSALFQKLGVRDRTQAAIFAYRSGLIPEE